MYLPTITDVRCGYGVWRVPPTPRRRFFTRNYEQQPSELLDACWDVVLNGKIEFISGRFPGLLDIGEEGYCEDPDLYGPPF